jgi:hypothetical protein
MVGAAPKIGFHRATLRSAGRSSGGIGEGRRQMRIALAGAFALGLVATESFAQEGSCVSALQSRIMAGEAVMDAMLGLDADCRELKARIDAFVAAGSALRKSDRAVRRACPAAEYLRRDDEGSVRFQFVLEVARKRLANCPELTKK